jgi:hypothetical protein
VRHIVHIDSLGAPNRVAELWGVRDWVMDAHERASEWMEKHVLGALCEDIVHLRVLYCDFATNSYILSIQHIC